MLDLLTRLVELQEYCERVNNHPQLTSGEKAAALCSTFLVRECLPQPVLDNYDRMQSREPELLHSPDLFAMAVLVATYVKLPPSQRDKVLAQFQRRAPIRRGSNSERVATQRHVRRARVFVQQNRAALN